MLIFALVLMCSNLETSEERPKVIFEDDNKPIAPLGIENDLREEGCNICQNMASALMGNIKIVSLVVCKAVSYIPKIGGALRAFCNFFGEDGLYQLINAVDKQCQAWDCCKQIGVC